MGLAALNLFGNPAGDGGTRPVATVGIATIEQQTNGRFLEDPAQDF